MTRTSYTCPECYHTNGFHLPGCPEAPDLDEDLDEVEPIEDDSDSDSDDLDIDSDPPQRRSYRP